MECRLFDLDLMEYAQAWEFQNHIFLQVKSGHLQSAIIFCRHYPVVTLGRSVQSDAVRACGDRLRAAGIEIVDTDRGGDITYHGPGQLIIYPIINLNILYRDVHLFLRQLEEIVIDVMGRFGIPAQRKDGLTGVWIDERKISSIGIGVRNWITFHGVAINVKKDDLAGFSYIRPCGMDIEMTSMESVLEREISFEEVKKTAQSCVSSVFCSQPNSKAHDSYTAVPLA